MVYYDILWFIMIYYFIFWYIVIYYEKYDILWYIMMYYDIIWFIMIYYSDLLWYFMIYIILCIVISYSHDIDVLLHYCSIIVNYWLYLIIV